MHFFFYLFLRPCDTSKENKAKHVKAVLVVGGAVFMLKRECSRLHVCFGFIPLLIHQEKAKIKNTQRLERDWSG